MTTKTILLAGLALMTGAAQAQTTAPATGAPAAATGSKVVAGAAVTDTSGASVGTIKSVEGGFAVLSTGTVEVRLPVTSFANGANGPVVGLTKAQVESAASGANAQRQADLKAQIAAGTTVKDTAGATVGKIEAVDGQFATVATGKNKVKLPVTAFAAGADGPVIGMTAAELDAAAGAAAPASAPAASAGIAQ